MIELNYHIWFDFNDALCFASKYGHENVVDRMLELGAKDIDDALSYACYNNQMHIVKKMLKLGAKFNSDFARAQYKKWKKEIPEIFSELLGSDIVSIILKYM